ncbi:DNA polymerase II [Psychrosphaera aestuarii]|uniref:DNA polymerase II n=1 Tax=Psychrosphaera aestuarii TaxID=1266052 RepID=UPI001B325F93|nr:DNA polymerase II [Psychrosphaera aestuarii]
MSTHLYQSIPSHGFIITRNQYDLAGKLVFEIWVKTFDKPSQLIKLLVRDQDAVCFVRLQDMSAIQEAMNAQNIHVRYKTISLKSFDNEPMAAIYSSSLRNYYKVKQVAQTYQIELFEADVKPIDRYLMERFIKGGLTFVGEMLPQQIGYLAFDKVKVKAAESQDLNLSVLSIDIECNEKGELFSIGLHQLFENNGTVAEGKPAINEYQKVLYNTTGVNDTALNEAVLEQKVGDLQFIEWLPTEKELLERFVQEVQKLDPDCMVGWNFISFDIRLIVRACERNGVTLALGRDVSLLQFIDGQKGLQRFPDRAYVAGRLVLDGIDVMKNATYHFASFSLDNVASELLDDKKLTLTEEGGDKLEEIKRLYRQAPLKLAKYNLQDAKLVSRIFSQEQLVQYLITRTKLTGLELDKTGGSVAAFTNLYMPEMHRRGWVAPNLVNMSDYVHSPGGFVMDSIPGIHSDVLVFDFKSLYPSIIRTFNIDPITLVEATHTDNDNDNENDTLIPGFRGGKFTRNKSILSSMLDTLWTARETAKKNQNLIHSNAIKIIMNSFYGVLGSAGCRFYDTKLASSITMRGHWVLNESKAWFHENGLEVIYGDTDSVFISLANSNYTYSDGKVLESKLNAWWKKKIESDFGLDSKLEMEFETYYSPFFMPTIRGTEAGSKKRYAGKKQHHDGTSEIIFKGLESVRSDWTPLAKSFQRTLFELIFDGQPCREFVENTIKDLRDGKLDDLCVYRKRIRQHLSEYVKTTPPQIKAARLANRYYQRDVYQKGSLIQYVISITGPVEYNSNDNALDYEHYISKQLYPIAESILVNKEADVLGVFKQQMTLLF